MNKSIAPHIVCVFPVPPRPRSIITLFWSKAFKNRQNDKIKKGDSKKVEKITSSHDNIVSGDGNKVNDTKRGNIIRNGTDGTGNMEKSAQMLKHMVSINILTRNFIRKYLKIINVLAAGQ